MRTQTAAAGELRAKQALLSFFPEYLLTAFSPPFAGQPPLPPLQLPLQGVAGEERPSLKNR